MSVILSFFARGQEVGFPIIHNYLQKDYNNSSQIFGLTRDNRGIMYFGVGGGVMEYDGVSWRNISNTKDAYSYALSNDKKGRIYVGANAEFGYLEPDLKGNLIYKSLIPLISDTAFNIGAVWSVKLTSKFVYFRTYNAVLQYDPSLEKLRIFKADPFKSFSLDFVFHDTYYTRQYGIGLMKIENNGLIQIPNSTFFREINSLAVLPYDESKILVATRTDGINLFHLNEDNASSKFPLVSSDFIANNNIYCASQTPNGNFVLGSLKKGALLIDKQGKTLQSYQESNLLQDNEILSISSDTNQNLWLGLNNGISKTGYCQDLSYWDKYAGLKGVVENVIRYKNTIYIATSIKVYYIDKNNQVQEVQNIPVGQSWSFLVTKNTNTLLVAVFDGIYEIKENKAVKIYLGTHVSYLYQSTKNSDRIFGIDRNMLVSFTFVKGKWLFERTYSEIDHQIAGFTEDEKGDIWIGTSKNGVLRISLNDKEIRTPVKVFRYSDTPGTNLPFKFRNKIIFSSAKGLYVYNSKTDHLEPFRDLGDQFCTDEQKVSSLIEMPDGRIWIAPSDNKKGDIGFLKPNLKGAYDWIYAPFRRIPEMEIETFYVEPSGIAWIGGNQGLYRYDQSKDTKNYSQHFNCLIRKITTNDDSTLYGGYIPGGSAMIKLKDLKFKYNNLKFEFAAPFFDREENTLYSYQLVGYDKDWSKWSRETNKAYSKIHEGTYTFRVKARNIYNVESSIDSCTITILPPWYRTIGAYLAYLAVFILFIWLITGLNSRRLKTANIRLEKLVEERTLKISRQKEEILEKVNELQLANAEKDKFFSIIAHDLRGPFGSFLALTQIIDEELGNLSKQELQSCTQSMRESASNLHSLLENLLQWARMQQGLIHFNPISIPLHLKIEESISMVLDPSKNKGIKLTNNVPEGMYAFADLNSFQSVIRNLVSNALKFTPQSGTVIISAKACDNKYIEISIADTGIGMSESMLENLFRLDIQTNRPGTEGEPSSGLGLLLCKEFIEKNGGEIRIESKEKIGSTFYFTIPSHPGPVSS